MFTLKRKGGYTDVLFLGGGVYEWDMDGQLRGFLEHLPAEMIGQIIPFSTTGLMDCTLRGIRQIGQMKGIKVNEEGLLVKMLLRGHALLGAAGGDLTRKQQEKVHGYDLADALRVLFQRSLQASCPSAPPDPRPARSPS